MKGWNRGVGVAIWAVPQTALTIALTWLQVASAVSPKEPSDLVPALLLSLCVTGLATGAAWIGPARR